MDLIVELSLHSVLVDTDIVNVIYVQPEMHMDLAGGLLLSNRYAILLHLCHIHVLYASASPAASDRHSKVTTSDAISDKRFIICIIHVDAAATSTSSVGTLQVLPIHIIGTCAQPINAV